MDFRRILVPVNGSAIDDETIRLACRLAKKDKGKIWVVYVIAVRRSLPLDAEVDAEAREAEQILSRCEGVADEEEYEVETDLLQARDPGPTIVDEAAEREADLILMGVEYKRRFGKFSLGNVALYVLENSPCRVILYQHNAGGEAG